ncbi:hypothetical protein NESM_000159000 [Novymonas esmeraldas]|uniref:Uncharacterized protein n=1 Tax=Novymonas esmeraldas TaxID=1808958 RepID=A0AAW0F6J3_9TRYP
MAFSGEAADLPPVEALRPAFHKQADFAAFLVTEYFTKPSKQLEQTRHDDTNGLLPLVSFDSLLPGGDIEQAVGLLCDETHLIDDRHVQVRRPFRVLEKPLLVPAVLAALLHRVLLEKAGVFLSSTTFDLWASTALGFPARVSRLWLDACARVDDAMQRSSLNRFPYRQSAAHTGIHAIKTQASPRGVLFRLWSNACSALSSALGSAFVSAEWCHEHFSQAIERAIRFRREIASSKGTAHRDGRAWGVNLHAAGEPELCSCVVFHAFFRQLGMLFQDAVTSKGMLDSSAQLTSALFVGCLNAFTYYRYSSAKAECLYKLLDTVADVTDGKRLACQFDLKSVTAPQASSYLDRATVLSCDEVFGEILHRRPRKEPRMVVTGALPPFAEMNSSAISIDNIFPFSGVAAPDGQAEGAGGDGDTGFTEVLSDSEEDANYAELTTVILDTSGDDVCAPYLLSSEEAAVKRQVQERLYGSKSLRNS